MTDGQHNLEELLLDAHLDQLDDEERKKLSVLLVNDPALQRKNERLARALRPLDHYSVAPVPPSLVEKILARAAKPQAVAAQPNEKRGGGWKPILSLREIAAVAACLVLMVGALVPTLSKVRQHSQRMWCEENLGSIYRGLTAYQGDFDGSLPYRGNLVATAWLPGADGDAFASNSRHMYTMLKHGYVSDAGRFHCPARGQTKPADTAFADLDDFPNPEEVSYDSLNLAGANPNVRPSKPIAYVGDTNPLFNHGRFDDSVDPVFANSLTHQQAGQNVLLIDGSAKFLTSPVYGDQRDNVWMTGNIRKYKGTESPTRDDDAQLVPGFRETKQRTR